MEDAGFLVVPATIAVNASGCLADTVRYLN